MSYLKPFNMYIFIASLAVLTMATNTGAMTVDLKPNKIAIDTFYEGGNLEISGKVPAEADVLIRLSGESHDITMKKKGKVSGVLWMNVADVTFKNVPPAYLIYTSKDSEESIEDLGLGFDALKKQIEVLPTEENKDADFENFLKLKKKERLYSLVPGAVQFVNKEGSMKNFDAKIHLSPRLKQGSYKVEVMALNDGGIIDTASEELKLEQTGFPAFLSAMAFNRALLYGLMAVVAALLAGLGMSIIFKDKGGAH